MGKKIYQFEDFLSEVKEGCKDFAKGIHDLLLQGGYKAKIELKASGFFISYSHPKTRRSILNFLMRKKGLLVRVYADNVEKHTGFLDSLPENMEKEIAKSAACKRLADPQACNPKCVMGYDFSIRENHYAKCRYGCFTFAADAVSAPYLSQFISNEMNER